MSHLLYLLLYLSIVWALSAPLFLLVWARRRSRHLAAYSNVYASAWVSLVLGIFLSVMLGVEQGAVALAVLAILNGLHFLRVRETGSGGGGDGEAESVGRDTPEAPREL